MNKELIDDVVESLGLTKEEVDVTYWLRGEVEVLEYYLTKAMYRTEYGLLYKDGKISPMSSLDVVTTVSTYGVSVPVYRNVNRHTGEAGDWTEFTR